MMRNVLKYIIGCVIYVFFAIAVLLSYVQKEEKYIIECAGNAFRRAFAIEQKLFISQIHIQYHQQHSPNEISGEEKKNWCEQSFFILKDPNRYKLDSLFRAELHDMDIKANTAIGYRYGDKTFFSADAKSLESAIEVSEYSFRKDYSGDSKITLKAYVWIPYGNILVNNLYTYLLTLILLGFIGWQFYVKCLKKNAQKTISPKVDISLIEANSTSRIIEKTKWIRVYGDYFWDKKRSVVLCGKKRIMLKGESAKFFSAFLTKEDFILTYSDICKLYDSDVETYEIKDRTYHSVKILKTSIAEIGLQIKTLRGKGYELLFPSTDLEEKT